MEIATLHFVAGSPSVLTSFTHKTPTAVRAVIGVFASLAFLAPIAATIIIISNGDGFKFGIFISATIFWAVSFHLFRMFLWNSYGKEVLTLHNDKIDYYCDYKYFQGNKKEIAVEQLQIEIKKSGVHNELGILHLTNSSDKIEMVIPVPLVDLLSVEAKIKNSYQM